MLHIIKMDETNIQNTDHSQKKKEIARQLMYSSTKHNVKQARIEKKNVIH